MSKHLQNLFTFSFCKDNYFIEKNIMKTISCALFWPISKKKIYEIYYEIREMDRYVKAAILLFVCYYGISKFITKIYMKI